MTKGSGLVYRTFLKPLLLKYEKDIDRFIDEVVSQSTSIASDVMKEAKEGLKDVSAELNKPENLMKLAGAAGQASQMADEFSNNPDKTE